MDAKIKELHTFLGVHSPREFKYGSNYFRICECGYLEIKMYRDRWDECLWEGPARTDLMHAASNIPF